MEKRKKNMVTIGEKEEKGKGHLNFEREGYYMGRK